MKTERASRNGESGDPRYESLAKAVKVKRERFMAFKSPSLESMGKSKQRAKKRAAMTGGLLECMTGKEMQETIARGIKRLAERMESRG